MNEPAHRRELVRSINTHRAQLGKLRRTLPKAPGGPNVTRGEMSCAYHLEQAIRQLQMAEDAWIDPPSE